MAQSNFAELDEKYFSLVADKLTELYNGKEKKQEYYFKNFLRPQLTADLSVSAIDIQRSIVSADIVSMDSTTPLKKRESLKVYKGTLPKLAIKYAKGEKEMRDLQSLIARNMDAQTIINSLYDDMPKCIDGIHSRIEMMFLQGLSTGVFQTSALDNQGQAVRMDYGYPTENNVPATTAWATVATSDPIADIQTAIDKARGKGVLPRVMFISRKYFDYMRKSESGKALFTQSIGQFPSSLKNVNVGVEGMQSAISAELGLEVRIIDSVLRVEGMDGTTSDVTAWQDNKIILAPSTNIGRLVYGQTTEELNPVAGVSYTKADNYISLSRFAETDPWKEYTKGEALVIPVIDNASSIFTITA